MRIESHGSRRGINSLRPSGPRENGRPLASLSYGIDLRHTFQTAERMHSSFLTEFQRPTDGLCASRETRSRHPGDRIAGRNLIGIVVRCPMRRRDRPAQQWIVGRLHPLIHPLPHLVERRAMAGSSPGCCAHWDQRPDHTRLPVRLLLWPSRFSPNSFWLSVIAVGQDGMAAPAVMADVFPAFGSHGALGLVAGVIVHL